MVRYRIRMGYGKSIPCDARFCTDDNRNEIADYQAKGILLVAV
jgi:hypothetical protein